MTSEQVIQNHKIGYIIISFVVIFFSYSTFLSLGLLAVGSESNEYVFGVLGLSQFFFLLGPAIYFARKIDSPIEETFRLSMPTDKFSFLWAFIALIGLQFFTSGIIPLQNSVLPESMASFFRESYQNYLEKFTKILGEPSFFNITYALLAIAVTPGICEELVFRGYLQKSLEKALSYGIALTISSFIFALIHFSIETFIPLLAAGYLLGIFAYKSGSIFPSMMIHVLLNAASTLSFYFNIESAASVQDKSIYTMDMILLYICLVIAGAGLMIFGVKKASESYEL